MHFALKYSLVQSKNKTRVIISTAAKKNNIHIRCCVVILSIGRFTCLHVTSILAHSSTPLINGRP